MDVRRQFETSHDSAWHGLERRLPLLRATHARWPGGVGSCIFAHRAVSLRPPLTARGGSPLARLLRVGRQPDFGEAHGFIHVPAH